MKELYLPSCDGVNRLHVIVWEPEGKARAVVQISHGMIEYVRRYAEFAEYLNKHGFVVLGNDHLGHGLTAADEQNLGYFCEKNMSASVVHDLHSVTAYAKKQYPGLPLFLFGHSMGSFLARRYMMNFGYELTGAIICGTGGQPGAVLAGGRVLAELIRLVRGDRHRSKLLQKAAFQSYNARIKDAKTSNDWLSRREENVERYNRDKYCTYRFTVNGYRGLFSTIAYIQRKSNIAKLPKELPVFLIAGEEDPVGAYGKGVLAVSESYKKQGLTDVECKLYPQDRHEILNEEDREVVFEDVRNWLEKHLPQK